MWSRKLTLAAASLSLCSLATAHAESLEGTWSGRGYVKPTDGERQNVNCRVTLSPHGTSVVAVSATCTTETTTIHQTGQLTVVRPGRYIGDFYNPEFDISGRIRVSVSGSYMTVDFSGGRGKGSLNLSRR